MVSLLWLVSISIPSVHLCIHPASIKFFNYNIGVEFCSFSNGDKNSI